MRYINFSSMSENLYSRLLSRIEAQGYDLEKLKMTPQDWIKGYRQGIFA